MTRPDPRRGARAPLAALLLAPLALWSCAPPPAQKAEVVRPVRAEAVALQPLVETVTYSGDVRPRFESALGFRIAGKIETRPAEVGLVVRQGDVLARLDPADVALAAGRARSALGLAEADLAQAQLDHDRYKALRASGTISQAEYDRRLTQVNVAKARVAAARADLDLARNQADYADLVADADGIVVAVAAEAGEVVAAGQPVARLAHSAAKEVVIAVPEGRIQDVRAAEAVAVALWADPGRGHRGTVREIAPQADPVTRTYAVKVAVDDPEGAMQLGMTASVTFSNGDTAQAIVVPPTALTQEGTAPGVWVVDPATGTVALRRITVARYQEDRVIVAEGLAPGDVVVTAGAHKLSAGQKVRVLDKAARL
jgi:RND family efflux transporter MFP subunit